MDESKASCSDNKNQDSLMRTCRADTAQERLTAQTTAGPSKTNDDEENKNIGHQAGWFFYFLVQFIVELLVLVIGY